MQYPQSLLSVPRTGPWKSAWLWEMGMWSCGKWGCGAWVGQTITCLAWSCSEQPEADKAAVPASGTYRTFGGSSALPSLLCSVCPAPSPLQCQPLAPSPSQSRGLSLFLSLWYFILPLAAAAPSGGVKSLLPSPGLLLNNLVPRNGSGRSLSVPWALNPGQTQQESRAGSTMRGPDQGQSGGWQSPGPCGVSSDGMSKPPRAPPCDLPQHLQILQAGSWIVSHPGSAQPQGLRQVTVIAAEGAEIVPHLPDPTAAWGWISSGCPQSTGWSQLRGLCPAPGLFDQGYLGGWKLVQIN